MELVSIEFLGFASATVFLCASLPSRFKWGILLVASSVFYLHVGKCAFLILLAASTFVYFMAIIISRLDKKSGNRRRVLLIAVIFIVLWVMVYKIAPLIRVNKFSLVSSLGVSYISFSMISYLVDVYWNRDVPETNYFRWLTFVLFFPKIIQGPISKRSFLKDSLYCGKIKYNDVCFGAQRMIFGYFKKLVIAERCAMLTTVVFDDLGKYPGSVIAFAAILASLQLYCDFSGYMDIVAGLSQCLGVSIEENFNHPFFSRSAAEFWRRWHITLGAWFKEYIYTPVIASGPVKSIGKICRKKIGKRFGNTVMKSIALFSVWFLTGLWHGTGIVYIIWGMMWGIIIFSSLVMEGVNEKILRLLHIRKDALDWRLFQIIRTSSLYCFGILLIRCKTLGGVIIALDKLSKEFRVSQLFSNTIFQLGLSKYDYVIIICGIFFLLMVGILQTRCSIREKISELHAPTRWILYALSASVVLLIGIYGQEYTLTGWEYAQF